MNPLQLQPISERAFRQIQTLFAHESGIHLSRAKQDLVTSRLHGRIQQLGLPDFDSYCELIESENAGRERNLLVDLLTTHETYFFREPTHFEHLAKTVVPTLQGKAVRVWCAAASTGEEAYSVAMTLAAAKVARWEVLGSDISETSLLTADRAVYRMDRLQCMPENMLKQYCLRGTNQFEGAMLITRSLRERVQFCRHNLLDSPSPLGKFDVIFLRNVLIYFDQATRQKIVTRALEALNPGGWLYTGHTDSLLGMDFPLETVAPSLHRKQPAHAAGLRATPTSRMPATRHSTQMHTSCGHAGER